jgi:hypothetical protein
VIREKEDGTNKGFIEIVHLLQCMVQLTQKEDPVGWGMHGLVMVEPVRTRLHEPRLLRHYRYMTWNLKTKVFSIQENLGALI